MSLATDFQHILTPQAPIAERTWFRTGGAAEFFAEPQSVEQLQELVKRCHSEGLTVRVLGGGSNILIRDEGVGGMVISLAAPAFAAISATGTSIKAGGGAVLAEVISESVRRGLAGLDPLVGIPGVVGGALHGNAGSRGGDIGQWTCSATVMTRSGEIATRTRDEMVFAYRKSSLDELVIIDAEFQLEEDNPEQLTKRLQKQWIIKKASQPMVDERTGSIFKNPRGMSAGMLIDQAGLRGASVGDARVSEKYANFIVAGAGATSTDVLKLIDTVRSRVAERLGVELETELDIW
ncbi:UDP-N-acetylenolpyruvoylglucosamine reductase MurB [Posidoniimonas polymericola]|uniref:UDP-N-acetylenolpyruvoylglucosamine reductase n=1 Tax=Posidoniimonas polymericola TaxID=2528002 RepID=A0A5C5YKQ8_9BACT|nr:UDP-N-acetylmuramate dehydrogenase [Posidoniimonas polymericola]TWT75474.1 UDP-N-acetylenolpyruvoylglucosamine reductase MurB [Posidoniimonas polymericola]